MAITRMYAALASAGSEAGLCGMAEKISMVIIGNDDMAGASLTLQCVAVPGVSVVGRASDGREGLAIVQKLLPTIALVDITMPHLNGIEFTRHVRHKKISTRVILIIDHRDHELFQHALTAGAAGYLLKRPDPEELGIAIREVARGKLYIAAQISSGFLADHLLPKRGTNTETLSKAFRYHAPLRKLGRYVHENPAEPLTLQRAADVAGLERTYFSAFFHQKTGITFKYWEDLRRIERAALRLRNSDDSISTIAEEFFEDLTTFERTFRRVMGLAPRDYRSGRKPFGL